MHGGAKGSGAPRGERNGRYRHGRATIEALRRSRYTRRWLRWAAKVVPLFQCGRVPVVSLSGPLALEKRALDAEAARLGIPAR